MQNSKKLLGIDVGKSHRYHVNEYVSMETNWSKAMAVAGFRAFSLLGSELAFFALVFREKVQGATFVSFIMFAASLAYFALAPLAGWIADRFSTRQIIPTTSILQAVLIFTLLFTHNHGLIFLIVFGTAICSSIEQPTFSAITPTLSNKEDLARVIGVNQVIYGIAGFLGPALGGFLVSQTGFIFPFVLDSFSFLVLACSPFLLRVNRVNLQVVQGEKVKVSDGAKTIVHSRYLLALLILMCTVLLSLGVMQVGYLYLLTDILGASATIYGVSGAAFAIGMLLGGGFLSRHPIERQHHPKYIFISIVVLALSISLLSLAWHWSVVVLIDFLSGLTVSIFDVLMEAAFLKTSSEVYGRVVSAQGAAMNLSMLISLSIAGPLIHALGVRHALFTAGIFALISVSLTGRRILSVRLDTKEI